MATKKDAERKEGSDQHAEHEKHRSATASGATAHATDTQHAHHSEHDEPRAQHDTHGDHGKERKSAEHHQARGTRAEEGASRAGSPPPDLHGDFPESVRRGYWVYSPNQHAQHPGQSMVTRSHDVITSWVLERNAVPATIPGTWHDNHAGVLRFDFPDFGSNERLEHVTWDEWFDAFDERELVMIFQEQMENGRQSNFFHLNSPFREHQ